MYRYENKAYIACSEWVPRQEFELEKLESRECLYRRLRAYRPVGQGPREIHLPVDEKHTVLRSEKFGSR